MARTKNNTQNDTKTRRTPHDATDIKKTISGVVFFGIFLFLFYLYSLFLKQILQEMLNYRLGTVNDFQWELKPVLSYSKSQLRH